MVYKKEERSMLLIVIIILGAMLGFLFGSFTDGFIFSTNICLFAGITMIMPSLFKFELGHVKLVWQYKSLFFKGLLINYLLLPSIALSLGFATGDFGITAGLFLISVLSGGGLVMFWINRSNGDTSLGFLLLFINLLFVTFSLLLLHLFATYGAGYFDMSYDEEISISRFVIPVIELLIIIPFIASRVVRYIPVVMNTIERYKNYISKGSLFIILFYLFGLQDTQRLVDIYDFEPELFFVALGAVFGFYLLSYISLLFIYDLNSAQERALFWHSITRYLTLALVIVTFSAESFGVSMLLPVMFAYLVQIPLSVIIHKRHMPDNQ
jgi:hypothetical protein